ncbi:hypothetical protein EDD37DRAFT_357411 [Exophiala viscosa]|uniref:Uncharacterized protein n=1 Tax=Exophiala viscosa TaxID=2486360 RepID=A0AAN6DR44_9EURO|nr:hypothetical protein EDD36DRAFT_309717 [Exophiala viscosa]KAI1624740.1 hypothetical protein EDD37DRAFT_357411 [Exophiala viscosa]
MEHSQAWNYPSGEPIYNPSSSMSISSYFARPNKVIKPSSRNTSPRNLGRRKTTTSATISSQTRSVVDQLRSHNQQQPVLGSHRSRPVSWHPVSLDPLQFSQDLLAGTSDLSSWNFSTAQVNGLVTPISYPVTEPQIQELITPLDEYPWANTAYNYDEQNDNKQYWLPQGQLKFNSYSLPAHYQSNGMPFSHTNQQPMDPNIRTAPSSPDQLPLQSVGPDTLFLNVGALASRKDEVELVGMGLYDSPAEVQSSSVLFGGISEPQRKTLKLEESFVPAEVNDESEDEEDAVHEQDIEGDPLEESSMMNETNSQSQSISNHLNFGYQSEVNPLAYEYLATLGQLNSTYYPAGHHGYGWI